MRLTVIVLATMFALTACGGPAAPPARGPDEVTATWTAGDDAPLEGDDTQK
jgi:hypothetical protein